PSLHRVAASPLFLSPFFTALLKLRLAVLYFKVISSNFISCSKTFVPESAIDVITTSTCSATTAIRFKLKSSSQLQLFVEKCTYLVPKEDPFVRIRDNSRESEHPTRILRTACAPCDDLTRRDPAAERLSQDWRSDFPTSLE
ncbi:hypothetical protein LDENG_00249320, partial [Lucifuga dentata]